MLLTQVYPWIWLVIWGAFAIFLVAMLLRLIFNFSDPNPFGSVGRFGFRVRKLTEKWVYPAARLLATYGVNTKYAPLITIFIGFLFTFFTSQIVGNLFFIIDGLTTGVALGDPKMIVGFLIYALLSILVLFIFIRFLSSWFVFTKNTFLGFVRRVTDPIIIPVQKLIPPVGMFDFSAMIVLIVINLLQSAVLGILVAR